MTRLAWSWLNPFKRARPSPCCRARGRLPWVHIATPPPPRPAPAVPDLTALRRQAEALKARAASGNAGSVAARRELRDVRTAILRLELSR